MNLSNNILQIYLIYSIVAVLSECAFTTSIYYKWFKEANVELLNAKHMADKWTLDRFINDDLYLIDGHYTISCK